MKTDRIDFIEAYCDRWCERCPFTMRCAAFDRHVAVAMCDGDLQQALELALSRPVRAIAGEPEPEWLKELEAAQPTEKELELIGRQLDARHDRVHAHPLCSSASDYSVAAHKWLTDRADGFRASSDAVVAEALEVVQWDAVFVGAKLDRAMSGPEDARDGDDADDHPIQNDWNGSAKVAMISLDRSVAAWRTIAAATGDTGAAVLADHAERLMAMAQAEFPRAQEFIRPGFDEPWR